MVEDLRPTFIGIFNMLLGNPPIDPIELDQVHRTPLVRNPSVQHPRDVLCRVHFFQKWEEIRAKAREREDLYFDGATISFYLDVSRRTLARQRALRPLTKALQDAGILY